MVSIPSSSEVVLSVRVLYLAIIKAKKGPLQTSLGEQGTGDDQKENQGTKLTIDASMVRKDVSIEVLPWQFATDEA